MPFYPRLRKTCYRRRMQSLQDAARLIEEVSCNAWPALHTLVFGGWVIRISDGRTRRTNSVQPLYPSDLSLDERLAHCISLYHECGLDALFKITPAVIPHDLDAQLASRGMARVSETEVQTADIATVIEAASAGGTAGDAIRRRAESPVRVSVADDIDGTWLDRCLCWNGVDRSYREATARMLKSATVGRAFITASLDGNPVGIAYAAFEQQWVGLFMVTVSPEYRRRGVGRAMVKATAELALEREVEKAYLQVFSENEIAKAMYRKLGFSRLYSYWYRSIPV